MILVSNTYWIGDDRPCLTYGMRGVIKLDVEVSGPARNLHSGVDGGSVFEPTTDLSFVLASLVDSSGRVSVPGYANSCAADVEQTRFPSL